MNSVTAATPDKPDAAVRRLADVDGPSGWPFIGNLAQIELPHMHERLERWAAEHGPTYRIRLGRRNVLVIARPDSVLGLLRDRPSTWRRMQHMQTVIREIVFGGDGLFSAEGDDWRRQRRLVMAAFDPAHLKNYFPLLVRDTQRLNGVLAESARGGVAIDLQTVLMRYTVDVTAGLAFGADLNTQQHPDNVLRGHLDRIFPMLMRRINAPFPWWRHFKLPSDREFDGHLSEVHAAVRGFVAQAHDRIARQPTLRVHPTNLLEAMIAAGDAADGTLGEAELLSNVMTVLLAGEDTTANTLAWTLYLLHQNPHAWHDLVSEVDATLGPDRWPSTFEAARGLDSIERCCHESMRLRPVAPLFFMENNHDTVLDGVALPEGTMVICLMRNRALDAGHADASEFRPGRWAQQVEPADRSVLKASMPFGAGPRTCPGRYLAMLEMKMVLATLARNFELVGVGTDDGAPPQERLAFTMFPVGLRMKLRERRPQVGL